MTGFSLRYDRTGRWRALSLDAVMVVSMSVGATITSVYATDITENAGSNQCGKRRSACFCTPRACFGQESVSTRGKA